MKWKKEKNFRFDCKSNDDTIYLWIKSIILTSAEILPKAHRNICTEFFFLLKNCDYFLGKHANNVARERNNRKGAKESESNWRKQVPPITRMMFLCMDDIYIYIFMEMTSKWKQFTKKQQTHIDTHTHTSCNDDSDLGAENGFRWFQSFSSIVPTLSRSLSLHFPIQYAREDSFRIKWNRNNNTNICSQNFGWKQLTMKTKTKIESANGMPLNLHYKQRQYTCGVKHVSVNLNMSSFTSKYDKDKRDSSLRKTIPDRRYIMYVWSDCRWLWFACTLWTLWIEEVMPSSDTSSQRGCNSSLESLVFGYSI